MELGNTTKSAVAYTTISPPDFLDPALDLALLIEFYSQYALIALGIFGIAANGLVLYALIAYHARETK